MPSIGNWIPFSEISETNFLKFWFNRWFLFISLNCRFAVAESDCNLAIALNRSYTKAYARRGAARFALQKLEDAKKGINIFQVIHI